MNAPIDVERYARIIYGNFLAHDVGTPLPELAAECRERAFRVRADQAQADAYLRAAELLAAHVRPAFLVLELGGDGNWRAEKLPHSYERVKVYETRDAAEAAAQGPRRRVLEVFQDEEGIVAALPGGEPIPM